MNIRYLDVALLLLPEFISMGEGEHNQYVAGGQINKCICTDINTILRSNGKFVYILSITNVNPFIISVINVCTHFLFNLFSSSTCSMSSPPPRMSIGSYPLPHLTPNHYHRHAPFPHLFLPCGRCHICIILVVHLPTS